MPLVFRRVQTELFGHFALIRPADIVCRDLGELVGDLVVVGKTGLYVVGRIHYLVRQILADISHEFIRGAVVIAEVVRFIQVRRTESMQYLMRIRGRVLFAVYAVAVDPAELIRVHKPFVTDDRAGIPVVAARGVDKEDVNDAACSVLCFDVVDWCEIACDVLPDLFDPFRAGVVEDLVGHFRLVVQVGVDGPVAPEVHIFVPACSLSLDPTGGELEVIQCVRDGRLIIRVGKVPGICWS